MDCCFGENRQWEFYNFLSLYLLFIIPIKTPKNRAIIWERYNVEVCLPVLLSKSFLNSFTISFAFTILNVQPSFYSSKWILESPISQHLHLKPCSFPSLLIQNIPAVNHIPLPHQPRYFSRFELLKFRMVSDNNEAIAILNCCF